jgi:GTPase SAR1 family protein
MFVDRSSFNNVSKWIALARGIESDCVSSKDIISAAVLDTNRNDIIIIIVGNKSDVLGRRYVKETEGEEKAKLENALFIESSAKIDNNVDELFEKVGRSLLAKQQIKAEKKSGSVKLKPHDVSSTTRIAALTNRDEESLLKPSHSKTCCGCFK